MENRINPIALCALASLHAYDQNLKIYNKDNDAEPIFDNYHCIHTEAIAGSGFVGVTFYDQKSETLITAFRGTDPSIQANIKEDTGICEQIAQKSKQTLTAALEQQYSRAVDYYFKKNPTIGRAQAALVALAAPFAIPFELKSESSNNTAVDYLVLNTLIKQANSYYRKSHQTHGSIALGLGSSSEFISYVTGHSLGGFLAQLVCAQNRSLHGITFNAPGAAQFLKEESRNHEIYNYVREHDVVGTLGTHIGETRQLKDVPTAGLGSWLNPFEGIAEFCKNNHSISNLTTDLIKEDGLEQTLLNPPPHFED
jgi:hypothetical protein